MSQDKGLHLVEAVDEVKDFTSYRESDVVVVPLPPLGGTTMSADEVNSEQEEVVS